MRLRMLRCSVLLGISVVIMPQLAWGQSFGIELHNTVTPAAGAMGGVCLARPQGVMSAVNGNPATLTQFEGTQFMVGGAWSEPTGAHSPASISLSPTHPSISSICCSSSTVSAWV